MAKDWNITANSKPDYDDWGPDDYWGPKEWILWHSLMKDALGKEAADRNFIDAYGKAGFGASSFDWRSFNTDFVTWAKKEKIYDALFTGLGGLLARPLAGAVNLSKSAVGAVEDAGKGIGNTIAVLSKILPAIIIFIVLLIAYFIYGKVKTVSA